MLHQNSTKEVLRQRPLSITIKYKQLGQTLILFGNFSPTLLNSDSVGLSTRKYSCVKRSLKIFSRPVLHSKNHTKMLSSGSLNQNNAITVNQGKRFISWKHQKIKNKHWNENGGCRKRMSSKYVITITKNHKLYIKTSMQQETFCKTTYTHYTFQCPCKEKALVFNIEISTAKKIDCVGPMRVVS